MGKVSKMKSALAALPDGIHMMSVETVKNFWEAQPKPEGALILIIDDKRITILPMGGTPL